MGATTSTAGIMVGAARHGRILPAATLYLHDRAASFRFVLRGDLSGDAVQNLDHAWNTAKPTLAGRELVVDVTGIASADSGGIELLWRMRESGARLVAAPQPGSEEVLRALGLPVAALPRRSESSWAVRILGLAAVRR